MTPQAGNYRAPVTYTREIIAADGAQLRPSSCDACRLTLQPKIGDHEMPKSNLLRGTPV